ncbi:MAG: RHS repeat-associated core domain-containing protein, partial [Fibrobacter sp.]|nr:RHS repeat-associated core domain-containing protein [Fibrobacter sp.]
RYGIEDAENPDMGSGVGYIPNTKFEWYLKNHLGSTMLVYGTQADANPTHSDIGTPLAAYDYRAFGEMVELLPPPTGKVTENFTGKEHDDEIALNYFGARYLDPMLGLWISVDPARQFASPYLYAGYGVNPVTGVDNTGNYMVRQRGESYEIKTVSTLDASVGKAVIDGASVVLAIGALVVGEEVGTALAISSAISGPLKGVAQGSTGETTIGTMESGASVVTGLESSMTSGVVGVLFSLFDIARSSDNIVENVDSKDCIDSFNSRMISNGGSDYNSFKTEQAAKDFMNSIPECRIDDNQ